MKKKGYQKGHHHNSSNEPMKTGAVRRCPFQTAVWQRVGSNTTATTIVFGVVMMVARAVWVAVDTTMHPNHPVQHNCAINCCSQVFRVVL